MLGRVAAALSGVPIRIFTVHGWAFSAHTGVAAALYERAERLLRPLTTITICVAESERVAGLAARACDPERTVVIRNGVDVHVALATVPTAPTRESSPSAACSDPRIHSRSCTRSAGFGRASRP